MKKQSLVLPCLRGVIGSWVYYSSLMSAKQVAAWIQPVKDIREAKSLDDELQRDLRPRQLEIAEYLLTDKSRFFNSIIVGLFDAIPDWAEFDLSKASSLLSSAKQKQDIKDSMGLLIFSGAEKLFAIDGQHRVAAISTAYNEEKAKPKEERILKDDQFSVIFIGHTDDQYGKKRTRKLFSDINSAKPVAGGDKIMIDERDLDAIVARRVYADYSHFKNGDLIALTGNANLERGDIKHFTNLLGLYRVNKILRSKLYVKEVDSDDWDEKNVVRFKETVFSFYDFIISNIVEYQNYFVDGSVNLADERANNSNLLFRPVGLFVLARLYIHFTGRLPVLARKLPGLIFKMPSSPFNGILWNKGKMEASTGAQILALRVALYMLGELKPIDTPLLLESYRELVKNDRAKLPAKLVTKKSA